MLSEELVFKSFLKMDRDTPVLVVLGRSFHHCGTTHEKMEKLLDDNPVTTGVTKL